MTTLFTVFCENLAYRELNFHLHFPLNSNRYPIENRLLGGRFLGDFSFFFKHSGVAVVVFSNGYPWKFGFRVARILEGFFLGGGREKWKK